MKCSVCRADEHAVLRTVPRDDEIRRTRRCARCGHTWATCELSVGDIDAARAVVEKVRELASFVGAR